MTQPAVKCVLIADDSEGAADLLAEVLVLSVSMPITTMVALNGAEAVALASSNRPDVALLDLDMPMMGGIDAALAIRAAYSAVEVPLLIAITGNALWSQHQRARGVFDHVFTKPADIAGLAALVDGAQIRVRRLGSVP